MNLVIVLSIKYSAKGNEMVSNTMFKPKGEQQNLNTFICPNKYKQVRNLCVYSRPSDRVWLPTGQLLGA